MVLLFRSKLLCSDVMEIRYSSRAKKFALNVFKTEIKPIIQK
jgi:hypothetical protein